MSTIQRLQTRARFPVTRSLVVLRLPRATYFRWAKTGGKAPRPAAVVPKAHWITPEERGAIIAYARAHPELGYARLTYQMADTGVAAVSPSSVYTILKAAQLIGRWQPAHEAHRQGFVQPERPHEQWHTDIAYLNILGTQYFLLAVLDGYSRAILHHEIRRTMTTTDVEIVIERARALLPADGPRPRLITDNGSQYVSAQFTQYLRASRLSHSRTRVGHPQSNGKYERWNQTAKVECVRRMALGGRDDPEALTEAQAVMARYVTHYNTTRPHSALHYLTPADYLRGPAHVETKLAARARAYRDAAIKRRIYWHSQGTTAPAPTLVRNPESLISA